MPQNALFDVLPSHIYVVAHWGRNGWNLTCHASAGGPGASADAVERFGPLTQSELLDVASSWLGSVLDH